LAAKANQVVNFRGQPSMFNRRAHIRVRPKPGEPVEAQVIGDDFIDVFLVRDISSGGIGFFVPHGFAGCNLDVKVQVVITLPHERSFIALGIIRHLTADGHGFGVQFAEIADEDRRRIETYVARRAKEGAEVPEPAVGEGD
jgi:hypothetical protein